MPEIALSLIKVIAWSISVLCKGNPAPNFEEIKCFCVCFKGLLEINDIGIISDTLWGIEYITRSSEDEELKYLLTKVPIKLIIKYTQSDQLSLKKPAIKILANLSCGSSECSEEIITLTTLKILHKEILDNTSNENILHDLCWIFRNIINTSNHVQKLINAEILKELCKIAICCDFNKIKQDAIFVLSLASEEATEKQIWTLVDLHIIEAFTQMLNFEKLNADILLAILQGLDNIMAAGQGGEDEPNKIANKFESLQGFEKINEFISYENKAIQNKADKILKDYDPNKKSMISN